MATEPLTNDDPAARESKERFRSLINTSLDIIAILDQNASIAYCNLSTERILGYRTEKLIGKNLLTFIHPADLVRIRSALDTVSAMTTRNITTTFRFRKADGFWAYLESTVSNLLDVPEIGGVVVTSRDITERKRVEDALKLANEKLNLLASITRHDILNKLTVLIGYLELAKRVNDYDTIMDFIRKMDDTAEVIREQIEFTRDYQNLGIKTPEWQNLSDVLTRVLPHIELGAIQVANGLTGVELYADPLLEKVVYNIIENAAKYGEKITTIRAYYREDRDGLVWIIEDDGIGIPARDKTRIFEKGFGKHTGLGLFLAREILAITGIIIMETGFPGKGARFEIHVPKGNYRISRGGDE